MSTTTTTSNKAVAIVASATSVAVLYVAWKVVIWRARTKAKETVDRVRGYVKDDGPLVRSYDNEGLLF